MQNLMVLAVRLTLALSLNLLVLMSALNAQVAFEAEGMIESRPEDDAYSQDIDAAQLTDTAPTDVASGVDIASDSSAPLTLADVIASLYRSYPEIALARQQPALANGELLSAYGAYDTRLQAHSLSEPTGFYENFRNGIGFARQTWWGGYVAAGYRIGRGEFQPWYKERQTDDAGEFKVGFAQPLLRGRAIDPQRVAVFQASIAVQAAQPIVQLSILESARDAAFLYWEWVAAGAVLEAQRQLLELAEQRNEQFEAGVEAGKFPEIDLILNQQLLAERQAKLLESEQKFRANAFKLSLYLRDEAGRPLVPQDDWLPLRFPAIVPPIGNEFQDDLAAALSRRPEPQLLQFDMRQTELDRRLACNDMLAQLDFVAEASQDMGEQASSSNDKGEFELIVGIQSEVPIQRRRARGKIQSTTAKIHQTNEKLRLVRDKIGAELQVANNAIQLASQIVDQSQLSLQAAIETLQRYRFAYEQGKIDLIYLNLLETKANESEINLAEARRDWFAAVAMMQFALGLDPLDQAMIVSSPNDAP